MTERTQAEALAFLADPATHGLAAGAVRRMRTHISELILAGERAFKVKRAVRYAFVDFTALDSRRAACEAELRLNRRTAPELYLGVAAVRRDSRGRLALDHLDGAAEGAPIEWSVVMRRFDDALTLDRLADAGRLRGEWIDALVDAVVALHDGAEVCGAPFGGAEGLRRVIDGNAADMAAPGAPFARPRLAALLAAQRARLAANAALLEARRAAGCVRRCHGDLHLGNVVLWRERPTIFDCIEFSDELAQIDVAYDLAFLLMDLETRGQRAPANRAFGRYVGRTGGAAWLAALPLLLSLRATVRAKVAGLAGDADGRAERFLAAAERFVAPTPAPRLIAIGGLSGTGKSTLALALAPEIGRAPGALALRSDVIRKRLAGVAPERRLPASAYTADSARAVYETLLREADEALAAGHSVVVDGVFGRPEERRAAAAIAAARGASFCGLWLAAPASTLIERVAQRRGDASDATAEVVARQLSEDVGIVDWHRLDAGAGAAAVARQARSLLAPDDGGAR